MTGTPGRGGDIPLPLVESRGRPRSRMGRRRAIALIVVHLLVLVHVVHFVRSGRTMTPLEPSEAQYSLVTGAINAGAILLAVLILSTLVLGRFFCGWACHVVAYQDLARWLMLKIGIRPRPVRSRLLLFVPLFAAFWLYVKPLIERWRDGGAFQAGWHLTTDDFWATFPGPTITILTFLICGFLIVYVLGSKGFCTYGCPYGGLFAIADRFAKGRIRVTDACDGSGECTINCSSNVNVAREVREFGMVVDPGCLKCMDCISVCPNDALYFGFGKSARPRTFWSVELSLALVLSALFGLFWASWTVGLAVAAGLTAGAAVASARRPGSKTRSDFTVPEELLLAGAFVTTFAVAYDLFNVVPLLMALGLAVIVAFLLLQALRRRRGAAGAGGAALVAVIAYAATVQWHTRAASAAMRHAEVARVAGDNVATAANAQLVERHVEWLDRWSVCHVRGMGRWMGELRRWERRPAEALAWYETEQVMMKQHPALPMLVGLARWQLGEVDEARRGIDDALRGDGVPARRFLMAGWELRRLNAIAECRRVLEQGHALYPGHGDLALRLGTLLARGPDPDLRDQARALAVVETTCAANGRSHAELLGLLAWLSAETGDGPGAVRAAEEAATRARETGDGALAEDMTRAAAVYRQIGGRADH